MYMFRESLFEREGERMRERGERMREREKNDRREG